MFNYQSRSKTMLLFVLTAYTKIDGYPTTTSLKNANYHFLWTYIVLQEYVLIYLDPH